MPEYVLDTSGRWWWCNSHQRDATYVLHRPTMEPTHVCNPKLGGIMLPCRCVDLTDELERDCA